MFSDVDKVVNDVTEAVERLVKENFGRFDMENNYYVIPTEGTKSREFYLKLIIDHMNDVKRYINKIYDKDDVVMSQKVDAYIDVIDGEMYHNIRSRIKTFEGFNREYISKYDNGGALMSFSVRRL